MTTENNVIIKVENLQKAFGNLNVLAGEEAGSKLTKAQALGVKIIDEEEFLRMVEEDE